MSQKSIIDLLGQAAGMMNAAQGGNHKTQKEKAKSGFSLLQPMLQNALDLDDVHTAGTKVEDLDDDNVMDLLGNMAGGLNVGSLLKDFDMDQMGDIFAFVQEKFSGASNAKQQEHTPNIAGLISGLSDGLDMGDVSNLVGAAMSFLKK